MIVPTFLVLAIAAVIANASPAPAPAASKPSDPLKDLVSRATPPTGVYSATGYCTSGTQRCYFYLSGDTTRYDYPCHNTKQCTGNAVPDSCYFESSGRAAIATCK